MLTKEVTKSKDDRILYRKSALITLNQETKRIPLANNATTTIGGGGWEISMLKVHGLISKESTFSAHEY